MLVRGSCGRAWQLSSGDEAAGLAGLGVAGDAGDLVDVHVRVAKARGAQAVLKRGRERGVVQGAVGDDRGVDAVIGLADLVLNYAWRLDHDCAYDERVDGDSTVAEYLIRASFDGGVQVGVAGGGVADEAVGEL